MTPIIVLILPVASENTEAQEQESAEFREKLEAVRRELVGQLYWPHSMQQATSESTVASSQSAPRASEPVTPTSGGFLQDAIAALNRLATVLPQLTQKLRQ